MAYDMPDLTALWRECIGAGAEFVGPAYFNEIDQAACSVLRECHSGVVDQRSIKEVTPDDVRGFERAHFFAGAGLWQIAAARAGWRGPLWTASCPCQPFSIAGKGAGRDDPRHLWPDFFRLARAVRPPVIVGEQVAGAAGFDWFDGVAADLEGEGYACRAVDIPACAVDAPHRRQRLYWVAVAQPGGSGKRDYARSLGDERWDALDAGGTLLRQGDGASVPARLSAGTSSGAMADANGCGHRGRPQDALGGAQRRDVAERADGGLGDAYRSGLALGSVAEIKRGNVRDEGPPARAPNPGSAWSDADWLQCADGKSRRAPRHSESDLRNVAYGLPNGFEGGDPSRLLVPSFKGRAAAWRLAGNAIVPQVAAQVLLALQESLSA